MHLALEQTYMQPAALIMLALFIMASLVFLPREYSFIRNSGAPWQARFIAQDILITASVLAVLIPCISLRKLSLPLLIVVLAGFTLLWAGVLWAGASRYSYVRHLLNKEREESEAKLRTLLQKQREEEGHDV